MARLSKTRRRAGQVQGEYQYLRDVETSQEVVQSEGDAWDDLDPFLAEKDDEEAEDPDIRDLSKACAGGDRAAGYKEED